MVVKKLHLLSQLNLDVLMGPRASEYKEDSGWSRCIRSILAPDYPMHMRKGQSIVIVVVVHKKLPDLEIYRHLSDL